MRNQSHTGMSAYGVTRLEMNSRSVCNATKIERISSFIFFISPSILEISFKKNDTFYVFASQLVYRNTCSFEKKLDYSYGQNLLTKAQITHRLNLCQTILQFRNPFRNQYNVACFLIFNSLTILPSCLFNTARIVR